MSTRALREDLLPRHHLDIFLLEDKVKIHLFIISNKILIVGFWVINLSTHSPNIDPIGHT